ncbi:MAG: hypothetical protein N4A59_16370 [Marinifilum sp.]|jgi:hypothetical protein|nr:hypothetical protein [Marinifilum sp.]
MTREQRIAMQEKRVAECRDYLKKSRRLYEECRQKTIKEKAKLQNLRETNRLKN